MSDAEEQIVLVDSQDRAIGVAGKLAARREGRLRRVSSVVRGRDGRLLPQPA
jgi:hypothetical protein